MALGWGIVGAGTVAEKYVAPAIARQPDSRLLAVFDVDPDRVRAFAAAREGVSVYDDYSKMLADPALDIVYVASPNAFHAEQVIAAVRAGKHVLCEKPMALKLEDGRAMVKAAKDAGRLLGVGFHLRHKPSNVLARKLVGEGRLGRVFFAHMERGSSKSAVPHHTWRSRVELAGGGSIFNQALHPIDLLRFVTGRDVASISAKVDRQPIEDVFAAVCTMDDGSLALLNSHQLWPNTRPDYVVYGERGWLRGVGTGYAQPNDSLEIHDESGVSVLPGADGSPYWYEVDDFVKAVLGQAPLSGDGEDGLHAIAIVEAIYRSVQENRTVDVQPIW